MIGQAFTDVWKDRHRILLTKRARYCLDQWGYTADTIPLLFEHFDADGNGFLNLYNFREMMTDMNIGLSSERVNMLFESFDEDGSGGISSREFIKAVFPNDYHEIFCGGQGVTRRDSLNGIRVT